jgi:hypothetical protein
MVGTLAAITNQIRYSIRQSFWSSHAQHMDTATCEMVLRFGIQQCPELENNFGLYRTLLRTIQPEDPPEPPNDPVDMPWRRGSKRGAVLTSEVPAITEEEHTLLIAKAKELLVHINPNAVCLRKLPVTLTRKGGVWVPSLLFFYSY